MLLWVCINGDRMLFVAVDPIAEANQRVLLWVCIKEIGCFLSQSIR